MHTADADPRPRRRGGIRRRFTHRIEIGNDLDVISRRHLDIEVAVIAAARVLLGKHLRDAAADIDKLIRTDRVCANSLWYVRNCVLSHANVPAEPAVGDGDGDGPALGDDDGAALGEDDADAVELGAGAGSGSED